MMMQMQTAIGIQMGTGNRLGKKMWMKMPTGMTRGLPMWMVMATTTETETMRYVRKAMQMLMLVQTIMGMGMGI